MKILVVDNYDSFVYNIVHMLYQLGVEDIEVYKNDRLDLEKVSQFDKIILSPGPGIPSDAGLMPALIQRFAASKSILGICLGHQALAEQFGGQLVNMSNPLHGVSSALKILKPDYLFDGITDGIQVGHYHSWLVQQPLPEAIEILAVDPLGQIMAIKHRQFDCRGLQFHPESILTEQGIKILANWVSHHSN